MKVSLISKLGSVTIAVLALAVAAVQAAPVINTPTRYQVIAHMEPDLTTFVCNCDFHHITGRIDNSGCESPGERAVVGNIVPASVIRGWLSAQNGLPIDSDALIKNVLRDPLNLTIFSDKVAPTYHKATQVLATDTLRGDFGACIIHHDKRTGSISIPSAKMIEFARTALYLKDEYDLPVPDQLVKHYQAVSEAAPPSQREELRNAGAFSWNGSWNTYVNKDRPITAKSNSIRQGIVEGIHRRYVEGK